MLTPPEHLKVFSEEVTIKNIAKAVIFTAESWLNKAFLSAGPGPGPRRSCLGGGELTAWRGESKEKPTTLQEGAEVGGGRGQG